MSDEKKELLGGSDNRLHHTDPLEDHKITRKDLREFIPALLEYLKEDKIGDSELASFWSLVPKQLVIDWRNGVKGFFLEKDVYSRQLVIVHEPVKKDRQEVRAIFLYNAFKSLLPDDQFEQIWRIGCRISNEDKEEIIREYKEKLELAINNGN